MNLLLAPDTSEIDKKNFSNCAIPRTYVSLKTLTNCKLPLTFS